MKCLHSYDPSLFFIVRIAWTGIYYVVKTQDFQDLKADVTCSGHCILKVKKGSQLIALYGNFSGKFLLVTDS